MTQSLEKIMEEVEINVDGITDEIKSYELTPEQYEWFLLQASKVQKSEEDNMRLHVLLGHSNGLRDLYKVALEEIKEYVDSTNFHESYWDVFVINKIISKALKGESV